MVELEYPGEGKPSFIETPMNFLETPAHIDRLRPPAHGEHTMRVLREPGFRVLEIEQPVWEKLA